MRNYTLYMFAFLFLALCGIQEYQRRKNIRKYSGALGEDRLSYQAGAVLSAVGLLLALLLSAPLPVFGAVLFLTNLCPYFRTSYINITVQLGKVLIYMTTLLIVFSLIRIAGIDMSDARPFLAIRMAVLCLAQFLLVVFYGVLDRILQRYYIAGKRNIQKERFFAGFLFTCFLYTCADSLLCMMNNDTLYVPSTLLFGNALIAVLGFVFLYYGIYSSAQDQLQHEYQQIEMEQALQDWSQKKLLSMTHTDALTGAYSRRYAVEQLTLLKNLGRKYAVVYIDMDHMKLVNDRQGHAAGDLYLKEFVEKITELLPADTFLARMGGDEFLIVFGDSEYGNAEARMREISVHIPSYSFTYGIARSEEAPADIIRQADVAMYDAKKRKWGGIKR